MVCKREDELIAMAGPGSMVECKCSDDDGGAAVGDMGGVRDGLALADEKAARVDCCGVVGTETDRDVAVRGTAMPGSCECDCVCTGRGSPGSAVPDLPRLNPAASRNCDGAVAANGLVDPEADPEAADGDSFLGLPTPCPDFGVTGAPGDSSSTANNDKNRTVLATAPHHPPPPTEPLGKGDPGCGSDRADSVRGSEEAVGGCGGGGEVGGVVREVVGVVVGVWGWVVMCRVVVIIVMSPLLVEERARGVEEAEDGADMLEEGDKGGGEVIGYE